MGILSFMVLICILWLVHLFLNLWAAFPLWAGLIGSGPYVVAMSWASDVLLGPSSPYKLYSKIRGSDLTPLQMSLPDG